jgi:hypothetical protein
VLHSSLGLTNRYHSEFDFHVVHSEEQKAIISYYSAYGTETLFSLFLVKLLNKASNSFLLHSVMILVGDIKTVRSRTKKMRSVLTFREKKGFVFKIGALVFINSPVVIITLTEVFDRTVPSKVLFPFP